MFFAARNISTRTTATVPYLDAVDLRVRDAKPIDLWDAWLFAEAEASLALQAWFAAVTADKAHAHVAYRAALDREEQAARVLADRVGAWLLECDEQRVAAQGV
jgi:hypothetical protein